jgi:hypothetical protein
MASGHTLQTIWEIGQRFDIVELGGGNKRTHRRRPRAAAIGAREQMLLAAECDGRLARSTELLSSSNGHHPGIGKERPAGESIADRLSEAAAAGDTTNPIGTSP